MSKVLPFRGLLPPSDKAALVSAVPYDVVSSAEAAALAKGNPLSFLRVSRPEIELPPETDPHADEVYSKALANFGRLCAAAPLTPDSVPELYVYSLKMGGRVQTGIAGAVSAEEYRSGVIKKHEKTRRDKEDDRARHVMTLRSHTGPVFLTHKESPEISSLTASVTKSEPYIEFTAPDGVEHKLWKTGAAAANELSKLFEKVPALYIADGHHRAAAAARAADDCRAANPAHTGKEDYNFFLAVIFPAPQLKILSYNRIVKDLDGLHPKEFLSMLQDKFEVSDSPSPTPPESGTFCMFLRDKWSLLRPRFDISKLGVIERLDVSVLQDNILCPLLDIDDPRTSKRIDFVGGIRGTAELEKHVRSGNFEVAFSMFPTTIDQLIDIADANGIMPPKSTWFEPKLRDGLVCHNF